MTTRVQFGVALEVLQHRQHQPRLVRRRGVLTVFLLIFLFISILMMMLVLNWIWLVLHNRDMQRRSDVLALSAAVELLDDGLLEDKVLDQSDDVIDAESAVAIFRDFNNQVAAATLFLEPDNVTVTPGRVNSVEDCLFMKTEPYNALRVNLHRYASGPNPARFLFRGFGALETADVKTASVAALDSRVIGFWPTDQVSSPLVPLAIAITAWTNDRISDVNSNGRFELEATLKLSIGDASANAALVDFDEKNPVNTSIMPVQITAGVSPSHLTNSMFGPATLSVALPVPATQKSPPNTNAIVDAVNEVAVSSDARRIFPLYDDVFSDPLQIIGFVAARVLGAANTGGVSNQLRVTVEPTFIVHMTVVTDPAESENKYIHKLRLVQ